MVITKFNEIYPGIGNFLLACILHIYQYLFVHTSQRIHTEDVQSMLLNGEIYSYVCIHIYINTHMYTNTYIYICINIYTFIYIDILIEDQTMESRTCSV
jgi:hypothetical protein